MLERLQRRVLYFDMDSVIFTQQDGEYEPPTGEFLGDLKCETDGEPITAFVSGGPKNYAYRLESGETVRKIRGFTLGSGNARLLNFDTMEDMVLNDGLRGSASVDALNPFNVRSDRSGAARKAGRSKNMEDVLRPIYCDLVHRVNVNRGNFVEILQGRLGTDDGEHFRYGLSGPRERMRYVLDRHR